MSVAVEAIHSNLAPPQSPVSISTDSSRRDSLRQSMPEKHADPPTPISPQTRLSRKRAASLNTDSANEPRIGDLALGSAKVIGSGSLSDSLREQVCLCQPDPKIPRPRNAFILYRQHYQAQVVAQHPGLANPEISKIIGEQWKQQALEVKNDWKRLAEEEKQRHQRQYPGYRYQPRRAGKPNGIRPISSSSSDDPIRCPKCNGRYISTPSTPLTPLFPALGVAVRKTQILPSLTPSHTTEIERPNFPEEMHNTRIDTPRTGQSHPGFHRSQHSFPQPVQTIYERDEDMDLLTPSSGLKRRRFNEENQRVYAANSPIPYSAAHFNRSGPPMSTGSYRQQLPAPGMIVRQQGNMGPPPQQSPVAQHPRFQNSTRITFDESLRLPPLQTQMPKSAHPNSQRSSDSRIDSHEIQAKSVEAMVMEIPFINKIKVLSKISPPLPPPAASSPAQEIRGSVIVIESLDNDLSAEIGVFIDENLSNDCAVKTWSSSTVPPQLSTPATNTEMARTSSTTPSEMRSVSEEVAEDPFVDYFSIIQCWHKNSREMTAYITTRPTPKFTPNEASQNQSKIFPVALVRTGFSLTISDAFALRIPINDSYAPVDHWQWMATLWRGIVGPDLTIYAMRVGKEEMAAFGGVEIRSDCAAIVVRVLQGEKMDEKTARRLGFEVQEFVRNVDGGFRRF